MELTEEAIDQLKSAMGYKDGTQCCRACKHFVPDDCSGANDAKHKHCTLSQAIDVPVNESGHCKHFGSKPDNATLPGPEGVRAE